MTPSKRLFDLIVAVILGLFLLPVLGVVALTILILDGRPVFYLSERMKTTTQGFTLVKFRTMKPVAHDTGVSGGDKSARITRTGSFLRRTRLDELPQLWNVIKGEMSFVGPRPPLRQYVEAEPALYTRILISRPGVTGMASVYFHRHEEWLLSRSRNTTETDSIYRRACVPRKARLDLIYQNRQTLCLDISLMFKTVVMRFF